MFITEQRNIRSIDYIVDTVELEYRTKEGKTNQIWN